MDDDLTGRVIGAAMKVHQTLGSGFLESVYQRALVIELAKSGLDVVLEKAISVTYEGQSVGEFNPCRGAVCERNDLAIALGPVFPAACS